MNISTLDWHPFSGCSPISTGCANCYAMSLAAGNANTADLTKEANNHPIWNGQVRFNEHFIDEPKKLRAPHVIFVCPHGDLFHENARTEWVDQVFNVMELCRHHAFRVLTKRANRMEEYVNQRYTSHPAPRNVHFGVSAERQIEADERIPHLLHINAHVRYITFYPLLGRIDATAYLATRKINFVYAGEEGVRPMDPAWATDIEAACTRAGVPYCFGKRIDT